MRRCGQRHHRLTSIPVGLFGKLVFRVAVGVNGAVQLLKCHESQHELVVGVEETTQPLLVLDIMNLDICWSAVQADTHVCRLRTKTHIAQDGPPQLLARLKLLHRNSVLRNALLFAVDALECVYQIC